MSQLNGTCVEIHTMELLRLKKASIRPTIKRRRRGQSGIARSTTDGNNVVLCRDQTTTSDSRILVPVKQYQTKDNTENSFPDKGLDLKKTFSVAKSIYFLNIDTHFVRNQYVIDKVVMDITERAVNKYREAQAYGYRLISTLEVYA